jgi:hypothetical protein
VGRLVWCARRRSVSNGVGFSGQPPDVKFITQGVILLLAVTIDANARRGRDPA